MFPTDVVDLLSYVTLFISGFGLSGLFVKHVLQEDDRYKACYFGILLCISVAWFFYSGATIY